MRNPIGYLGCILFLETLPVKSGPGYMARLQAMSIFYEGMRGARSARQMRLGIGGWLMRSVD